MSASATIDTQLVSRPDAQLLYMSRRSELRLTLKSRYPIRGPHGQVEGMTQGQYVGFRDGVFRCPGEGTVVLVDTLDGGESEIDADELTRRLDNHRLYGNRDEGFWRVDPTAPAPSKDEVRMLVKLGQKADVAGLERMLEQERAGWNRPDFVENIEEALRDSRLVLAELEAEQPAPEQPKPRGRAQKPADEQPGQE